MFVKDLGENIYNRYKGILKILMLDSSGNVIKSIETPNVITYEARRMMTYLLAGNTSANKYVKYLKVGEGSTAPTRNDTALETLLDFVEVTYTFPDVDRVQFEGIIPNSSPANGHTLTEAGLFNEDGQMFARQIYDGIGKTSAVQLKYIWTIIYT